MAELTTLEGTMNETHADALARTRRFCEQLGVDYTALTAEERAEYGRRALEDASSPFPTASLVQAHVRLMRRSDRMARALDALQVREGAYLPRGAWSPRREALFLAYERLDDQRVEVVQELRDRADGGDVDARGYFERRRAIADAQAETERMRREREAAEAATPRAELVEWAKRTLSVRAYAAVVAEARAEALADARALARRYKSGRAIQVGLDNLR